MDKRKLKPKTLPQTIPEVMALSEEEKRLVKEEDKLRALAKQVVDTVDKKKLANQLVQASSLKPEDAAKVASSRIFIQEVHDQLVASITAGALQIQAVDVIRKKLGENSMEAAKLVLSLSKHLQPAGVKQVHQHLHLGKGLAELDRQVSEALKDE